MLPKSLPSACLILAACTVPMAQKAVPVPLASTTGATTYSLTVGGTTLHVGGIHSARVLSLKHQGVELMYVDSASGGLTWGSTFWPSPQAYWTATCKQKDSTGCFPPPAALDPNPYTGGLASADTALTFTGAADGYTRLRFRKTFSANHGDSSFTNRYAMINTSAEPITFAPWENTRFASGGLLFFPMGLEPPTGNARLIGMTRDTLGATWFTYDSSAFPVSGTPKLFGDCGAAGWFARVDKARLLHVKKFRDTAPLKKAPTGESECEIYAASNRRFLEMELQGAYDPIAGNDSVEWEVKWYVRKLPDDIAIGRNAALLAFVNRIVSGSPTGLAAASPPADIRLEYSGQGVNLELPRAAELSVSLFSLQGRELARLASGPLAAGRHALRLDKAFKGAFFLIARDPMGRTVLNRKILAGL